MKKIIIAFLLMLTLVCGCASAAVPEPTEDFYVLDTANVLDVETEGMIVFSNDLLYATCGAQIVVVAVKTTDGEDIADYAYDLYNEWQIGNEEGEGFLLLMAIDDEDYYLLPGEGLDTVFTGGTLRAIMDEYLEPDFAAGDYDAGADKTFRRIFEMTADACDSSATVAGGISLYETYISSGDDYSAPEENAYSTGAAQGQVDTYNDYAPNEPYRKVSGFSTLLKIIVIIIVLIALGSILGGRRYSRTHSGARIFPIFTMPRARRTPPPPPGPGPGPGHGGFGGPGGGPGRGSFGGRPGGAPRSGGAPRVGSFGGSRMGSFGGSRSGASRSGVSRSSGRSGGFGGGRSGGGGRSRGGGGGRGR